MGFIGRWVVLTLATMVAVWLVPGIETVGGAWLGPIMCALVLALVNATVKPIMNIISLPLTIITLGIFYLVLNALMLQLASFLSREIFHAGIYIQSFGSAFIGAIIISIVAMIVGGVTGLD